MGRKEKRKEERRLAKFGPDLKSKTTEMLHVDMITLNKIVDEEAAKKVKEKTQEYLLETVQDLMGLVCYSLNKRFEFGPQRLNHLLTDIGNHLMSVERPNVIKWSKEKGVKLDLVIGHREEIEIVAKDFQEESGDSRKWKDVQPGV